ncbi:MAG: tRNA-dihydrouridine synthase [Candidatus Woesearchaeota archaeon]|jgi:nifR3 family TIM-barrel protein
MQIGTFTPKNPVFLAPMLGVNCQAFIELCVSYGAGLVYTQFIDSDDYDLFKISHLFDIHPIAVQIIGSKKDNLLRLMKELDGKVDVIDVNLGCPLPQQLAKKSGAFFMKHPEFIEKIFADIIPQIKTPVTAKIRSGWDEESINAPEVCKILEKCGFAAISVHARTKKQVYTGQNDWELIKKCKEAVKIPIIGSGDITKPGHAKSFIERGYCDAVMIGREAQKNPYIIKQCSTLMESNRNLIDKSKKEQFFDFYKLYSKHEMKLNQLKDHAIWFSTGLKNATDMKQKILFAKSCEEIAEIFRSIL